MGDVDRLRTEALAALQTLSDDVGVVKDKLVALIEQDPEVISEEGEPFSDEGFVTYECAGMDRTVQALLYLVTGLYGRARVAEMAGVSGDAEPVQ